MAGKQTWIKYRTWSFKKMEKEKKKKMSCTERFSNGLLINTIDYIFLFDLFLIKNSIGLY